MTDLKVDVIVPTYNYGHFLDQCLASVVAQTFDNFNVIVIDNASTDNTRKIAQAWCRRDSRIRYIRNKTNLGPSKSSIKAYLKGNSPYAIFLAADDAWLPTFLEKAVAGLDEHPDCAFAYSLCSRLVNGETVFGQNLFLPRLPTGPHDILNYLAFTNWIYPSFCLIRRESMEATGLFKPIKVKRLRPASMLQGLGDLDMWLKLHCFGNAYAINERLGLYRIHGASETSRFRIGRRDIVELMFLNDYLFRYESDYALIPRLLAKVNSMGRLATNLGVVRVALEMVHSDKFRDVVAPVKMEFLRTLHQVLQEFKYDVDESDSSSSRTLDRVEHIQLLEEYFSSEDPAILTRLQQYPQSVSP